MTQIARHFQRSGTCYAPRLPQKASRCKSRCLKVSAVLQEDPPSSARSSESPQQQQLALIEQQLNRLLAPSLAGQERPPPQELQPEADQVFLRSAWRCIYITCWLLFIITFCQMPQRSLSLTNFGCILCLHWAQLHLQTGVLLCVRSKPQL